jgi:hypothetical protein
VRVTAWIVWADGLAELAPSVSWQGDVRPGRFGTTFEGTSGQAGTTVELADSASSVTRWFA